MPLQLVSLVGCPLAVVNLGAVPQGGDVVFPELLLQCEIIVQVIELAVIVGIRCEAGAEREAVLVVLHGKLKRNCTAHDLLELREKSPDVDPCAAALVGALGLHLPNRAAELREDQGNREVLEFLRDGIVGRDLEVVLPRLVGIFVVAPRVDIEPVSVDDILGAFELACQVPANQFAVRRSHVHVGVDERDAAHAFPALLLVPMDVPSQRLHAWECGIAILVSHGHLVRDRE
mmetsp:Transcript_20784/g.41792  ORF Transcript_20784/g.41792 Transcript_20784/m.41792 type:complete len:232 (+) Transcript_20784:308-1003(+)